RHTIFSRDWSSDVCSSDLVRRDPVTDGVASVLSRPARAPVVGVEVRRTPIGGRLDDFLNVVDRIYRGDPNYIRPLDLDLKRRLKIGRASCREKMQMSAVDV